MEPVIPGKPAGPERPAEATGSAGASTRGGATTPSGANGVTIDGVGAGDLSAPSSEGATGTPGSPARKVTARKAATKKTAAKAATGKAPAKKATTKALPDKTTANGTSEPPAEPADAPVKKGAGEKAPAAKTAAKKAPAKKAPAKKAPAKKAAAKKTAGMQTEAKKAVAKKAPTRAAPPEAAPAEAAPVEKPPAQAAPVGAAPVGAAPVEKPPAQAAPAEAAATEAVPTGNASPENMDTESTAGQSAHGAPGGAVAVPPDVLLRRLRAHPDHVPELLALAAVHRFGSAAQSYLNWLRVTYPGVPDDSLARHVIRRFGRPRFAFAPGTRRAPLAALAGLVQTGTAQARLGLYIAAAFGHDPTDPDRAAELLALVGVHPDVPTARAALRQAMGTGPTGGAGTRAALIARLAAAPLGRRLLSTLAEYAVPGAGGLLRLLLNADAMQDFAVRAVELYRPRRTPVA